MAVSYLGDERFYAEVPNMVFLPWFIIVTSLYRTIPRCRTIRYLNQGSRQLKVSLGLHRHGAFRKTNKRIKMVSRSMVAECMAEYMEIMYGVLRVISVGMALFLHALSTLLCCGLLFIGDYLCCGTGSEPDIGRSFAALEQHDEYSGSLHSDTRAQQVSFAAAQELEARRDHDIGTAFCSAPKYVLYSETLQSANPTQGL